MHGRALSTGVLLLAAVLAATWLGLRPPSPLPSSAPAGVFSAERALPQLRRFLAAAGEGVPHPAGSEANARVGAEVVAAFRELGVDPRVDRSVTCNRYLTCTPVSNVVARLPGIGRGPPVLVSAHHDSVPAGPGAGDDASGVAIALEIARALRAEPAATDVILLVDDAEESGLGGAEAFLRDPAAREVGAIVNLEARGTGGPSLLFETAGAEARVARAAATLRHPVGSSLFSTIYGTIPNDTNLTVLRSLGVPGANLAFIDGAVRYHTPRDDLAHLDPRSVQHQGENALALVRALARPVDLDGEAVWFDLLGRWVVRFPERWALPLGIASFLLAVAGVLADARRGRTGSGGAAIGAMAVPVSIVAAAALGYGAGRALGLDPILRPWVANPGPLVAAFVLAGIAGGLLPAVLAGRWTSPDGLRAATRLWLAAGAVGLAATLPGASFVLLVPALVAGAGGILGSPGGRARTGGDLATLVAAGLVLLPPAWLLYPALGHAAGPAVAALVAIVALPLASLAAALPLRARIASVFAPVALSGTALAVALVLPVADVDAPERLVVYFHQEGGKARILASSDLGRLPPEVRAAAPFSVAAEVRLGWGTLRPSFEAPVAPLPVPGPEVVVPREARDGERVRWSARLRSARGAGEIQVAVPPEVKIHSFRVDGTPVPPPVPKLARWYGGWWVYRLSSGPEGIEVEMTASAPGPFEIVVADQSRGIPPSAAAVVSARPPWVVTQQEGDVTLFTRRVRIEAGATSIR
jgi:nitroreductase